MDIRSIREVFSGNLRRPTEENNIALLGSFLLLTVFRVGIGSSKATRTNGASILQELLLGIFVIHLKMTSVSANICYERCVSKPPKSYHLKIIPSAFSTR